MKILLTGATGFIGAKLSNTLVNDHDVHVIVRPTSDIGNLNPKINCYSYLGNFESMDYIFKRAEPQVVIHLASMYISEHKPDDIVNLIQSNVEFGALLLEAMIKNKCKSILNVGTSWQHYNDEVYNPVNFYSATKQAFESILKYYVEAKDLNAINLHLFDSYGVSDKRIKLLNLIKKSVNEGIELNLSPGEQEILLVNIDDLVLGIKIAIEYLMNRETKVLSTYTICNYQDAITLKSLINLIEEIVGKKLPINLGARKYRQREVFEIPKSLQVIPGYSQNIKLVEGLKEYFYE